MEINKKDLNKLIEEAVTRVIKESPGNTWGVDWAKMAWLDARGNKLSPKWAAIMFVRQLLQGDMDRTLAVLKSAVATLELHKNKSAQPEVGPSPDDEPMDFGTMNTGIPSKPR